MRVGVFLPNLIGDAVMATPALRSLRDGYGPDATLVGIMRPYMTDVLGGTPWLDERILYEPGSKKRELREWNLIRALRANRLDMAVLMPNSLRTAALAWLGGARRRAGYVRYGRGPLLTTKLPYPQASQAQARVVAYPMVDFYQRLAEAAGGAQVSARLELATTPADEAVVDKVWRACGFATRDRVAVFNCSGGYGETKLWPAEKFALLARRVADDLDHDVLVICGPNERTTADAIVRGAEHPRVHGLNGWPLSIGVSKACVRRARAMVTTDSGPRHFAVAFDVPVVTVCGPTPPVWGRNPTARETTVELQGLDCLGCHRRTCPLGHHRCMRDLAVETVFDALHARLGFERGRKGVAA